MIYLSGKIAGLDPKMARRLFMYREMGLKGKDVWNPIKECAYLPPDSPWENYMKYCIPYLMEADEIHMLPNWKESKGAVIEHNLAIVLSIKIVYYT